MTRPASARPGLLAGLRGDVLVILPAFLGAALIAGAWWPQLVDPVQSVRTAAGVSTDEVALAEQFDRDGWYAVLAGVAGLLLGLVLAWWRRRDPVATLLLVVVSAGAAAWLMARVGTALGPEPAEQVLAAAPVGTTAPGEVTVSAAAAYLVWPIAATAGALVAWLGSRTRQDG